MVAGQQQDLYEKDEDDPQIAKIADRVIELRDAEKSAKQKREVQELNLFGLMEKAGKSKVFHKGWEITAKKTESKRKISVKPQTKPKKGKGGRKRGGK